MDLVDRTITQFVDEVASDSPAPGGGSAAALSSALGAGLLSMAIRISIKKLPDERLQSLMPQLENDRKRLLELIDEDTSAFNQVMAAFALPKGTDEEKNKRAKAIQTAFQVATRVPLETMQRSLRVLESGNAVAKGCGQNVASDVGTGIQMAYAGLQGAGYNVLINMSAIKDGQFKKVTTDCFEQIQLEAEKFKTKALPEIGNKIQA